MNTDTGIIVDLNDDSQMRSSQVYAEARQAVLDANNHTYVKSPWVKVQSENLSDRKRKQLQSTGKTKVGRNEPCPCGSGKKFKKCHLTKTI